MKNSKFSDAQIMAILRQAENGLPVSELCREHGGAARVFTSGVRSMGDDLMFLMSLTERVLRGAQRI